MARTAITVGEAPQFLAGLNPTLVVGDSVNNHSVDLTNTPVILVCINKNASTVDFTIELPASKFTFNATESIQQTVPGTASGHSGLRVVAIQGPAEIAQTGNVLHIDSADANFADVSFAAFTLARPAI